MKKLSNRNLAPKILSILFAFVMWIYVMSEINPRITEQMTGVPVNLVNVQEIKQQGLVIMGQKDFQIDVQVSGRRDEVLSLIKDKNNIVAKADLAGFRAGPNNVPVEVAVNGNVEVDYNPKLIKIELEEVIKKEKQVSIEIAGKPGEGYVLGTPQFSPSKVWIEGPQSRVNAVDRVVAKLELSGDTNNVSASLPVKPVNSKGTEVTNVNIKQAYVNVQLPIDQLKSVDVEPNINVTAGEGYEVGNISVVPQKILLRGQEEILNTITSVSTRPIKINNIIEDTSVDALLDLPTGITTYVDDGIKVNVEVQKIVEKSYSISRDNINFINVQQGLEVDKASIPEVMQVNITATEEIINTLEEQDIQIVVNMKDLQADSTHMIEPIVNLPYIVERKVKNVTLIPERITVVLQMRSE